MRANLLAFGLATTLVSSFATTTIATAEPAIIRIEPAAINLDNEPKHVTRKIEIAPKTSVQRLKEENCLAHAVYFEARSESEKGQMAVAKVILNRTKSPRYPKTICGVVYEGQHHRNSCQFSFACDGQPEKITQGQAWSQAKRIANRAMSGDHRLRGMDKAIFYHADYVKPKWSKSMRKLAKIGRHVFYAGG
jgi:spore germination cell wall hydrolase CwlJ-like protein